jgi:hypothetical protein
LGTTGDLLRILILVGLYLVFKEYHAIIEGKATRRLYKKSTSRYNKKPCRMAVATLAILLWRWPLVELCANYLLVSCYKDDMSRFLLRSLNILCKYRTLPYIELQGSMFGPENHILSPPPHSDHCIPPFHSAGWWSGAGRTVRTAH